MKKRLVQYVSPALAAVGIFLLAAAPACSSQTDDAASGDDPSSQPTAASQPAPTPIPVSVELVEEFAADQQAINDDWDKFHTDFDLWRIGLTSCDRTAAQTALRGFASDFGEITKQARDLPGKSIARDLPDDVIKAATMEETSLRRLRDDWQPGNPAVLENAQTKRSDAAALLRDTTIEVDKLEELDKPEDQELAREFAEALAPVDQAWDAFYNSYAQLADDYIDLTAAEIVTRLRVVVEEQETVLESLEDLPSDKATDPVQDALIEAAEAEAEALGDLLDAMRKAAKAEEESGENGGDEAEEKKDEDDNGTSDENGGDGAEEKKDEDDNGTSDENGEDEAEETEKDEDNGDSNGNGTSASNGESSGTSSGGNSVAPQGSSQPDVQGNFDLAQVPGQTTPDAREGISIPSGFPPIPSGRATQAPGNAAITANSAGGGPASDEDGPDYSSHFEAFEEALDESKALRKKAERDLEAIIVGVSEEDREALANFTRAFDDLIEEWDSFHAAFDQWVRTEGNCNRAEVIDQLNKFSQRFNALGGRVRELSQVYYLRPSSDLMVEAVTREGATLRSLSSTWAPYESDVYRGLDEERDNAARLRRLADLRTQEVMERNGVSQ